MGIDDPYLMDTGDQSWSIVEEDTQMQDISPSSADDDTEIRNTKIRRTKIGPAT